MNYSTLKKTAALSFASLMAVGALKAQTTDSTRTTTTTTPVSTTTTADSTMNSSATTNAKVFGGRKQYNTWSFGVNAGVLSPALATGGSFNDFTNYNVKLGYGASLRWQLAHSFGLQLDAHGGKVSGDNYDANAAHYRTYPNAGGVGVYNYETRVWGGTLSGVVNVATIDYLRRKNAVNFFVTAGAGIDYYHPVVTSTNDAYYAYANSDGKAHYVKELVIPVGVGVKFRMSDAVQFVLGYTENFTDGDNLDGIAVGSTNNKDRYSYGYGGFEFTLGSKNKPNLDWANPVAMMYDELYDAALRQEVEALKGRVSNVENAVNDLKKDSDGDGVSDQFDKCPNTPAGTVVDGAGCEIKFPKVDSTANSGSAAAFSNIQFDFDSSVLRTSSYPVLDATSADLRSGSSKSIELDGYASSEGTAAHNMKLSRDRASSVKTYLVNSGVEARRVKVKGYGETHPIADNSTEEGRIQNRRVEFKQK